MRENKRRPFSRPISPGWQDTAMGSHYSDDEVEWLKAVTRWMQSHGGRIPDCREVLDIARGLGYRR